MSPSNSVRPLGTSVVSGTHGSQRKAGLAVTARNPPDSTSRSLGSGADSGGCSNHRTQQKTSKGPPSSGSEVPPHVPRPSVCPVGTQLPTAPRPPWALPWAGVWYCRLKRAAPDKSHFSLRPWREAAEDQQLLPLQPRLALSRAPQPCPWEPAVSGQLDDSSHTAGLCAQHLGHRRPSQRAGLTATAEGLGD